MISIDPAQRTTLDKAPTSLVFLVRHTFFSDKAAGAVSERRYWATPYPVRARWGGVLAQFTNRIVDVTGMENGFNHLPDAQELTTRRAVTLTLDTADRDGSFLFDELLALGLIGSEIEIATLAVEPTALDNGIPVDLSGQGELHVVRFRGEVTSIGEVSEESQAFSIVAETVEPLINWPIASGVGVDPRDVGKRYPLPLGAAQKVPLINRVVGPQSVLSQDIGVDTTAFSISSTDGMVVPFPALIDDEIINVLGIDAAARTVTSAQRGIQGTLPTEHRKGALLIALLPTTLVASARAGARVRDLFVRVPEVDDFVRIDPTLYTVDLNDTTTDTGRALTTIGITPESLGTALRGATGAQVATQPAFVDPGGVVNVATHNIFSGTKAIQATSSVNFNDWATTANGFVGVSNGTGQETARVFYADGSLPVAGGVPISRVRIVASGSWAVTKANGVPSTIVQQVQFNARLNVEGNADIRTSFSVQVGFSQPDSKSGNFSLDSGFKTLDAGTTIDAFTFGIAGQPLTGPGAEFDASVSVGFPGDPPPNYTFDVTAGSIQFETVSAGGTLVQTSEVTLSNPAGVRSGFGLDFAADFEVSTAPAQSQTLLDLTADAANWTAQTPGFGFANSGLGLDIRQTAGGESGVRVDIASDAAANWFKVNIPGRSNSFITDEASAIRITASQVDVQGGSKFAAALRPVGPMRVGAGTLDMDITITQESLGNLVGLGFILHEGFVSVLDISLPTGQSANWVLRQSDLSAGLNSISLPLSAPDDITVGFIEQLSSLEIFVQWVDSVSDASVLVSGAIATSGVIPVPRARRLFTPVDMSSDDQVSYSLELSASDFASIDPDRAYRFFMEDTQSRAIIWDVTKSDLSAGVNVLTHRFATPDGINAGFDLASVAAVNFRPLFTTNAADGINVSSIDRTMEEATEHPLELAPQILTEFLGIDASRIDGAALSTAIANTPGLKSAGDLRGAGESFAELLARIGFESRTNFWLAELADRTVIRADAADPSGAFPAAALTLADVRNARATLRELTAQATDFSALFDFRPATSGSDVEAFRGFVTARVGANDLEALGVTTADLQAAEARVGRRPSAPLLLILIDDEATALDVWGYYVEESLRGDSLRLSLSVPIRVGYTLEPTDIVEYQPRWADAPKKLRVIRTIWQPGVASVGIIAEEVR